MKNDSFAEVGARLKSCIELADKQQWQQLIMMEDDVARQSVNKWFEDYFLRHQVKDCEIISDDPLDGTRNPKIKCSIKVRYQDYEDYSADLLLSLQADDDMKEYRITEIEQYYLPGPGNKWCWQAAFNHDEVWWRHPLLIETADEQGLSCGQLARAVTRNIRFREAHIQLECASIMTFLMSGIIPGVCRQLKLPNENSEQKLKTIYDALRDKFRLQIVRPDRDNSWAGKYLAPWFGLEEVMARDSEGKRNAVSCNFFMSGFYSLLRWSGFKVTQLIQFRIVNQDYLMVRTDNEKLFLISHDNVTLCKKKTVYPSGIIHRVFGAEWFIDFKNNEAEISPQLLAAYNEIARHTFLPLYHLSGREREMLRLPYFSAADFRYRVFAAGQKGINSLYPWVKYAHQTLFVARPETYIYWSIRSHWGNLNFKDETEIYDYASRLGKVSIFPEADRIMTSDQCIRHQTGGKKDLAVFLFAAFKKFIDGQGCVVFTQSFEYVVYRFNKCDSWVLYNVSLEKKTAVMEGEVLLAFDDIDSYYPLCRQNQREPAWFRAVTNDIKAVES